MHDLGVTEWVADDKTPCSTFSHPGTPGVISAN